MTITLTMFSIAVYGGSVSTYPSKTILKGTPVLDGIIDDIYLQGAFVTVKADGSTGTGTYGDGNSTNSAEIYILYDDSYIYVAAKVYDATPFQCDRDYLTTDAHPHMNDAFEIRISGPNMAEYAAGMDHHLFYAAGDAQRFSSYQEPVTGFKGAGTQGSGYYIVECAIPLTAPLSAGAEFSFQFQIDDIHDGSNFDAFGIGDSYNSLIGGFKTGGPVVLPEPEIEIEEEPAAPEVTTTAPPTVAPQTGDNTVILFGLLFATITTGVFFVTKSKRKV
ncbi:MAG: LPXTG cell wall anchor domain-containing protein [Oscillospiraceae bacterium]|nr:LPXTG cell wall anchor domain-containing protein [Oscillospiraceae bacterium]